MTTKEWLNRARGIDSEIRTLMLEKKKARDAVTGIVRPIGDEKVQTSKRNATEEMLVNFVAYSDEIDKEIAELYAIKTEVITAINNVGDTILRCLLRLRYIKGLTWEEVADEMHYSYKHVCRLHEKALKKIKMSQNVIECHTPTVI